MRRLHLSAALVLALLACACGPTPPQAPLHFAKKLDEATSSISTTCGLRYQLTAFPGASDKDLVTLEATATTAAQKLAYVYTHNPKWIYQGETIAMIVGDSLSMLRSCGLNEAAGVLQHETHRG